MVRSEKQQDIKQKVIPPIDFSIHSVSRGVVGGGAMTFESVGGCRRKSRRGPQRDSSEIITRDRKLASVREWEGGKVGSG